MCAWPTVGEALASGRSLCHVPKSVSPHLARPLLGALVGLALALASGCKTDANCENDCMCQLKGWCGADWGSCEPTRDEHCERSEVCRLNGLCKAEGGKCIAKTDEQCRASRACLHLGACRAEGGRCR